MNLTKRERLRRGEFLARQLEKQFHVTRPAQAEFIKDVAWNMDQILRREMPPGCDAEVAEVEVPASSIGCEHWCDGDLLGLMGKALGGKIVEEALTVRHGNAADRKGNPLVDVCYKAFTLAHYASAVYCDHQTPTQRSFFYRVALTAIQLIIDDLPGPLDPLLN